MIDHKLWLKVLGLELQLRCYTQTGKFGMEWICAIDGEPCESSEPGCVEPSGETGLCPKLYIGV